MKISVNHLGFRPLDHDKRAVIWGKERFAEFQIINLAEMGYNEIGPNSKPNSIIYSGPLIKKRYEWGEYYIADFSDFSKPGIYMVTLDNKFNSVPFHIRDDLYARTLRKAFDYIHIQRCGEGVPGYHPPCHLDDARRRDTGEHIDTAGGWHDAGDLRKWVAHTLLLGIGICELKRLADPAWNLFDQKEGDLLSELRWGNSFFLKVQEESGLVWHDVAGGVDGDNSDNHWTDNISGTPDDRYINTEYLPLIQWEFIYFESMMSHLFRDADPLYSRRCLDAAAKTFDFMKNKKNSRPDEASWAILALLEFEKDNGRAEAITRLTGEINLLLDLQEKGYRFGRENVRGFWYKDLSKKDFFRSSRDSGLPLIALSEAALSVSEPGLKEKCLDALSIHCHDYALPMALKSPFGIIPFGLYKGKPTREKYRPAGGGIFFRFFAPAISPMYSGLTSHLLSYAVGLTMAGNILKEEVLKGTGRQQAEWVMGGNPLNSCLMTGEGINNPYPHSRFLGLIPGGIMNGIAGLEDDKPFLDLSYMMDWRTTEYWSPHTCFYIWFASLIENRL